MMRRTISLWVASLFVLALPAAGLAKFKCTVESIEGTTLVLKGCQKRGLKRLKPGDTVSITKKRKRSVEGC